jgi:hypothetical protein
MSANAGAAADPDAPLEYEWTLPSDWPCLRDDQGLALRRAFRAGAVYAGHRYARELDEPRAEGAPFKRELPALEQW